jgi:hypothetical protein
MNSREKGKRGERQWRDELRAQGFQARRGQQFCGSAESPDVVCEELAWVHFEVKAVERLNIEDAMEQARRDAGQKVPIVAHRRRFRPWLVTMDAETFFKLLRGDFDNRGIRRIRGKAQILQKHARETKGFNHEWTRMNTNLGTLWKPEPGRPTSLPTTTQTTTKKGKETA